MFAQLASMILRGMREFEEAAQETDAKREVRYDDAHDDASSEATGDTTSESR